MIKWIKDKFKRFDSAMNSALFAYAFSSIVVIVSAILFLLIATGSFK